MTNKHIHFVTGRLAEHALRNLAAKLAERLGFTFTIDVLPITVAALMTTKWVARHVQRIENADYALIPGYCQGDLDVIRDSVGYPVERGPRDLRRLPEYFGEVDARRDDYGDHDIQILAEINHAPRLSTDAILSKAKQYAEHGADFIDIGCDPGDPWLAVGDCVRAVRDLGLKVSIDSLNPREIEAAVQSGAELVLSVNSTNRDAAADWGCEVVVIPDDFPTLGGLEDTIELLGKRGVPMRIDPVIEPIGCGFSASIGRYLEVRRRYPDAEMMMGIGNLTELTDVDSAGVNLILLGFCQELAIRSVLTTEVINWARTSVRECDLARRLVHFAAKHRIPPKHLEPNLVVLRDVEPKESQRGELDALAQNIKDHNYRLFAESQMLHIVSAQMHLTDEDPFLLFDQLLKTNPKNMDAAHAFYLGYELAKATTALTLGKEYRQDEALDWGYLTVPEKTHRPTARPAP